MQTVQPYTFLYLTIFLNISRYWFCADGLILDFYYYIVRHEPSCVI